MPLQAVVYSRRQCHLCEEAIHLLRGHGVKLEIIDIDSDESLRDKFDQCVPVIAINGKIRFRGRVNSLLLKRLVDASQAKP